MQNAQKYTGRGLRLHVARDPSVGLAYWWSAKQAPGVLLFFCAQGVIRYGFGKCGSNSLYCSTKPPGGNGGTLLVALAALGGMPMGMEWIYGFAFDGLGEVFIMSGSVLCSGVWDFRDR